LRSLNNKLIISRSHFFHSRVCRFSVPTAEMLIPDLRQLDDDPDLSARNCDFLEQCDSGQHTPDDRLSLCLLQGGFFSQGLPTRQFYCTALGQSHRGHLTQQPGSCPCLPFPPFPFNTRKAAQHAQLLGLLPLSLYECLHLLCVLPLLLGVRLGPKPVTLLCWFLPLSAVRAESVIIYSRRRYTQADCGEVGHRQTGPIDQMPCLGPVGNQRLPHVINHKA
jgi:hypothetical protein